MLPAESYARYQNYECPQFYPLFPFNRFSLGIDDMQVFKNTWKHGTFAKNMVISWHQDGIFFARMGMTNEAADFNTRKLDNSPRRFPTFWGPGHDWTPDHNWGGTGMLGLQEMLMQTIGDRILLLPAWPADWDVRFQTPRAPPNHRRGQGPRRQSNRPHGHARITRQGCGGFIRFQKLTKITE